MDLNALMFAVCNRDDFTLRLLSHSIRASGAQDCDIGLAAMHTACDRSAINCVNELIKSQGCDRWDNSHERHGADRPHNIARQAIST